MIELLVYETYFDDEDVGIAVVEKSILPGPIDESFWVYIPQKLFHRLLSVGTAYNMHFPQYIDSIVDTIINNQQCENFVNEIEFIRKLVNDRALENIINTILEQIEKVQTNSNHVLIISPP